MRKCLFMLNINWTNENFSSTSEEPITHAISLTFKNLLIKPLRYLLDLKLFPSFFFFFPPFSSILFLLPLSSRGESKRRFLKLRWKRGIGDFKEKSIESHELSVPENGQLSFLRQESAPIRRIVWNKKANPENPLDDWYKCGNIDWNEIYRKRSSTIRTDLQWNQKRMVSPFFFIFAHF